MWCAWVCARSSTVPARRYLEREPQAGSRYRRWEQVTRSYRGHPDLPCVLGAGGGGSFSGHSVALGGSIISLLAPSTSSDQRGRQELEGDRGRLEDTVRSDTPAGYHRQGRSPAPHRPHREMPVAKRRIEQYRPVHSPLLPFPLGRVQIPLGSQRKQLWLLSVGEGCSSTGPLPRPFPTTPNKRPELSILVHSTEGARP